MNSGFDRRDMIKIRRVEKKDLDKILQIRNQPTTRAFMFDEKVISKKEHYKFWASAKRNGWVILYKEEVVGLIRIENGSVGVCLDKQYRKKGIVFQALSQLKLDGCVAEVKPGNIASIKLFEKLGFKEIKRVYIKP